MDNDKWREQFQEVLVKTVIAQGKIYKTIRSQNWEKTSIGIDGCMSKPQQV